MPCCKRHKTKLSDHFDGRRFFDPEVKFKGVGVVKLLKWMLRRKKVNWRRVELLESDVPPVRVIGDNLRVSSVGHNSFLIQTEGLNILTDPVWSYRGLNFRIFPQLILCGLATTTTIILTCRLLLNSGKIISHV
eukprot:GHVR01024366.1.p1 GENE.GHVR01024366.1~~GHVR01024366.1.p1  ORF type:complete len:134 (+),score=5.94 GHVR01024366.1:3-404(+)